MNMLIKKLMKIAAERSLTGRRSIWIILVVIFGFLHGMRQQRGGVPMGQLVGWVVFACLAIVSAPPKMEVVKFVKTSMAETETQSWRRDTRGAVGEERRAGRVRVI